MLYSIFRASIIASALALPLDGKFAAWKAEFGKTYDTVEGDASALEAYIQNDHIIEEHNAKKLSYTLGHNAFSDMTWEEFSATHMGYLNRAPKNVERGLVETNTTALPDAVDWVAKGAVTPVKNQGRCGSCWAFSTTGSLEGAYQIATGKLTSLSEEDLVQCDTAHDQGCRGGLMDDAFDYIEKNGIAAEADYPYSSGGGVTGSCNTAKSKATVVSLTGHTDVPKDDEDALRAAVAKQPVSIAIEADKSAFQMYKSGILDNPACGTKLDHGVLVVGYGTDNGVDYWKVKNSWGTVWGEQGYIRMVRGKTQCGLASQASYPTGAKSVGPSPPGPTPPSPTPPEYKIHATRFKGITSFTCKGKSVTNETHGAGECFAEDEKALVAGYRLWSCGHPCPEGICLSEGTYDDANCTKLSDLSPFPNPNFVPTEKCDEQTPFNHFFIHCEGP